MARASAELIAAFRRTISKLKDNAHYEWGHMGACNCGNLAQEIAHLSKAEIHQYAMQKHGDWNDQLIEYCPTSGYPMDLMISKLVAAGLTIDELKHLEKLSDPKILSHIEFPKRYELQKNKKEDVILYLETWALILENEWVGKFEVKISMENEKNIPSKVFA
ncbi:hypothetical protein [Shivajiella indica]|uniref:Uncharacterized protein n=1 Tax=Shivajiella indica TaxID=872115 RepID=A0ABW5B6V1_9BACT